MQEGLFTASEMKLIPTLINVENENNYLSTIKGSTRMTLDEALKDNGRLAAEMQTVQSEKSSLTEKLKAAEDKEAAAAQKLEEAAQTQKASDDKNTQLEKEINELRTEVAKLNEKTIEAEVDAALAGLKDKILAAENSAENNFKLRRDLINYRKNAETIKDADGKSLYDVKLSELNARNSLDILTKPLGAADKPLPTIKKEELDIRKDDHRAWLAQEATRLAAENKTTFQIEYNKLIGDL
jgi:chromosome segregation ATPase